MIQRHINKRELDKAISEVEAEYGERPDKTLVLSLIFKIYDFLEKQKPDKEEYAFKNIFDICANDIPFTDPHQKSLVKKAAAKIFGSHGGRKSARVRKKEIPKKPKKKEKTYTVNKNGQLEFII